MHDHGEAAQDDLPHAVQIRLTPALADAGAILFSSMTKVEVSYELASPVNDATLQAIERTHGVYGLHAVVLSPSLDSLKVLYDASRLGELDVEAALNRAGLAVRRTA